MDSPLDDTQTPADLVNTGAADITDAHASRRSAAAARQRRHRAAMTDDQLDGERAKGRQRKSAMRLSPEYRALPPSVRHRKKGRPGLHPHDRPFVGVDGEGGDVIHHTRECNAAREDE